MESNLDQKQLLLLGYLRELITTHKLGHKRDGPDSSPLNSPTLMAISKYDAHLQEFNLGIGTLGIPQLKQRSSSIDSLASDLSDHEDTSLGCHDHDSYGHIIIHIYHYFNRFQSFLMLLGGSEECKDITYNQIQIINLRNTCDIKQKIDYPYTNYRLKPYLWREKINYKKYFNTQSMNKYLTQSKTSTVKTPQPISVVNDNNNNNVMVKEKSVEIKVESPSYLAMNSPYSPFAKVVPETTTNNENALSPFGQIVAAQQNLKLKPRSKSSSNLAKYHKKEQKKTKNKNKKNNKTDLNPIKSSTTKGSKVKAVSMKKRKSAASVLPKNSTRMISKKSDDKMMKSKSKKKKLKPKQPKKLMKRKTLTLLPGQLNNGKKKKTLKNAILNHRDYDRYSFGECIVHINNNNFWEWPWLKSKYKSDIGHSNYKHKSNDLIQFKKWKMFIRCGGLSCKDDDYLNENDLILFNASNLNDIGRDIDSYYCKLPPFKHRLESPSIIYNNNNNLLSFGGYSYDDGKAIKNIYSLNLNTKRNKFKWKKFPVTMNKPRYDSATVHFTNNLGQNKFMLIGGKSTNGKPIKDCELFDSSKDSNNSNNGGSKCTVLSELKFARFKPGTCKLFNQHKIVCCGGILYGKGTNDIEIYDIHKDKWSIHPTKLQYEHQHPSVWNESFAINPNIIYIAGNNITFGAKKGSLGHIEWADLREKKKKFNLLYPDPIEELYEFWAIRPQLWEPRSLLQFCL